MPSPEKLAFRLAFIAGQVARHRAALPPLEQSTGDTWEPIPPGQYWGVWQQDFVMRGRYQIPADWPLEASIALDLPIGESYDAFNAHPEALITIDGQPFTSVDMQHNRLHLPERFKDHAEHTFLLNGWTGLGDSLFGDDRTTLYMQPCALLLLDDATHEFVVLARTMLGAITTWPSDHPLRPPMLAALADAFNRIDTRHPVGAAFYESVPNALAALRAFLVEAGPPQDFTVHAAGHAHIDTAWLWPLAQTRRKAARTFSTVLHLMDRFPDYHFTQTQPQLYEFVREDHPDLFARIQAAVAAGRWEPTGGMWVEADCNITGAESLVRQLLVGRRYHHAHFGADSEAPVAWLPDTFGFPATLPQILQRAGVPFFFTTKLRWNEHNDFPYDSFWWQGLDGTRVLAHITPTPMHGWLKMATYNAEADAQSVIETWTRMHQQDTQRRALMAYGWGDGGGGPNADMLDNLRVLRAFPGIPRVEPGRVLDFFTALDAESDGLPVWDGELYLETHQGTLTSQAWIKRANRKSEVLLHDAELLSVLASLHDATFAYPREALDAAWRLLLLNQFHDILPGSSIAQVYADARAQFATLTDAVTQARDNALAALAKRSSGAWLVANTLDQPRGGVIRVPAAPADGHNLTLNGRPCVMQPDGAGVLVSLPDALPPLGLAALSPSDDQMFGVENTLIARPDLLENEVLRVTFDANGHMTGVYDKQRGWDVLAPGSVGNELQLFEDRPLRFDAWNIDPDYADRMWTPDAAESVEVVEAGPVRAALRLTWRVMHSTITQTITLARESHRLDIHTEVDWQERQMLLKVAFPVNVRAREARFHIQWGHVARPTHRSTPWDAARYEVAAHHWADLSDTRRGVALLNDCKYAYDVHENVLRLTLLKSPTYPDPEADRGHHVFIYVLYPHNGDLAAVYRAGADLNTPLLVASAHGSGDLPPLAHTEDGVTVETVKQAEDGDDVILRLLASAPPADETSVQFGFAVRAVWLVNLMEEREMPLDIAAGNRVTFPVRPHEIVTLRVTPEREA